MRANRRGSTCRRMIVIAGSALGRDGPSSRAAPGADIEAAAGSATAASYVSGARVSPLGVRQPLFQDAEVGTSRGRQAGQNDRSEMSTG